jgi:fatty acid CoA ligase FadD9
MEARVRLAVERVLGPGDLDLASGSFQDLGGDSVSALALSALLEEACGLPVPVPEILDPARSLLDLARRLDARRQPAPGPAPEQPVPGFHDIHGAAAGMIRAEDLLDGAHALVESRVGAAAGMIRAEDLRLDRFLGTEGIRRAREVAAQALPVRTANVLLTGANGFLGRALCMAWMEEMARIGGTVHVLVRAQDGPSATRRLRAAFSGDPALEARFTALAARHLDVLAGDLSRPGLGLAPSDLERLADEADLIVHPGALVNHVLAYDQLFGPNVAGTAQLIALALRGRRKRFDFVSTVGVLMGATAPGRVPAQAGVAALRSVWPLAGGYALGYATSKWAGERLLAEAHDRFAMPARVFRPGMILPHRRYRGQVNVPDLLTRLFVSVILTGLAPRTFYAEGQGPRAHFDGLPVDFIASAMVALSSAGQEDLATYQVSNPHWDDGISLDTLMDWVASAGHPLERMEDHATWLAAFTARLQALPEAARRHSSLPLLHQWAEPVRDWERDRIDTEGFAREVRARAPGGETGIPHLDEAGIHAYLGDLRALGLLDT